MKNRWLISILFVQSLSAYAYTYNSTPTGAANPPEIIEQDPNIPSTPTVYGPQPPLSKQTPPGTLLTPGASNKPQTYNPPPPPSPVTQ